MVYLADEKICWTRNMYNNDCLSPLNRCGNNERDQLRKERSTFILGGKMNTGAKIGLGLFALGGASVAGAYLWMGSTSTLSGLLEAIPHDTVVVMTSQGVPEMLENYHILNSDMSPAFFTSEEWDAMRKDLPIEINPAEFVVNAKINPLGITAMTGAADFTSEVPKSLCGAYYLPSLSASDTAEYLKTFAEEQMKAVGMPLSIENTDGVYSIMEVAWVAHSDWVVFATCEAGSPQEYLKTVKASKNSIKSEPVGDLLSNMTQGNWQLAGALNIAPLHSQIDTLADMDRDIAQVLESINIKEYQALGVKGYMGTGEIKFDMSLRLSSTNAQALTLLTKIDTDKMIDRLPGDPIVVLQQGFDIQKQLDLMLKVDPMMQEQYESGKTEFQSATGMDLEQDLINKIGNQAGMALVHDDFVMGAHVWLELESGHKFKDLTEKALAEMGAMGEMGLNKDEKEGAIFIQTPPSMSSMIGIPDVSLTVGVTPSELVISAGKSTPNMVKDLGKETIASKMNSSLKSAFTSSSYGAVVFDFESARKLLENDMVKSALDSEMRDAERVAFDTVTNALKDLSITSSLDGDTITTSMTLNGTNSTAFSDIVKDVVIPEVKKTF